MCATKCAPAARLPPLSPRLNELDPIVLLWWMRRRVCVEAIGKRRVVIQFDFSGGPRQSYWLLIEHSDVSVCLKNPGFDINAFKAQMRHDHYDVLVDEGAVTHFRGRNEFFSRPMPATFRGDLILEVDGRDSNSRQLPDRAGDIECATPARIDVDEQR